MMERVIEYLANAVWQLPLLAAGAWCMLRAVRVGPLAQHRVWVMVLGLGVLLPLAQVGPKTVNVRPKSVAASAGGLVGRVGVVPVGRGHARVGMDWLRRRSVQISPGAARGLVGVYLALGMLGVMRIGRGWMAARRLVREAAEAIGLGEMAAACSVRWGMDVPRLLVSGAVSSPATVGTMKPVVLLPEGFAAYGGEEMRAALLHEMAHIRRQDYAMNLLCEMAAVPLVWHPVVHAVQSRIRSTREMVCDAMAVEEIGSAMVYARALVRLAGRAFADGLGESPVRVGLFTNNNLEERVMRLTETKQAVGARARFIRVMGAVAGMGAVVVFAAMVHLTPAMAQTVVAPAPQAASAGQTKPVAAGQATASAAETSPEAPTAANQANPPDRGTATGVVAEPLKGLPSPPEESMTNSGTGHGMASVAGQSEERGALRSEPVGMAKGEGAYVEPKAGYWMHQWTATDGEPFQIMNKEKGEPTAEERRRFEEQFAARQAEMQEQVAKAQEQLNSAEFKAQMARLNGPEFKRQMAEQMKAMKKQMEASKIQGKEMQRQVAEAQKLVNSPEMQRQMAEARAMEMSPEMQKQMAEMKAQMAAMSTEMASTMNDARKGVEAERQKHLEEQLKQTQKELDEARKELQAERLKAAPLTQRP